MPDEEETVLFKDGKENYGYSWHGVGTNCFVTFEYPDQQRIELLVAGNLYGTLMIGDTGKLKSQGNCMLDFQRHLKKWDLRDKPDKKAQDEEKSGKKNSDIKTTAT